MAYADDVPAVAHPKRPCPSSGSTQKPRRDHLSLVRDRSRRKSAALDYYRKYPTMESYNSWWHCTILCFCHSPMDGRKASRLWWTLVAHRAAVSQWTGVRCICSGPERRPAQVRGKEGQARFRWRSFETPCGAWAPPGCWRAAEGKTADSWTAATRHPPGLPMGPAFRRPDSAAALRVAPVGPEDGVGAIAIATFSDSSIKASAPRSMPAPALK
jgi:hypothetical protein